MSFAAQRYKSASVGTASPAKIVVLLYDGALKFLRQASKAMEAREFSKKGVSLSKAHAIVSELQATLDKDKAPELCEQLNQLYDFVLERITQANLKNEADYLQPAINVMKELREAWVQVEKEVGG